MNILVYEYFSAGGLDQAPASERLNNLGWAMLNACIEDCVKAGHQVCTILQEGIQRTSPESCVVRSVPRGNDFAAFKEMLNRVDAVLPIAPESGGILSARTSWVQQSGKLLLGSTMGAVKIASDKFASYVALKSHGCKLPMTAVWSLPAKQLSGAGPWILKPRCGAGCQGLYLTGLPYAMDLSEAEYIIQEFVPGTAASVAMVVGKNNTQILSVNLQKIVFDPAPRYRGGAIPLVHPMSDAATECARSVPRAIPGLRGYVGVDMILTANEVYVIEVNPRITFTYCGLRRVVSKNLMEVIIDSVLGSDSQNDIHVNGSVEFDDLGRIYE